MESKCFMPSGINLLRLYVQTCKSFPCYRRAALTADVAATAKLLITSFPFLPLSTTLFLFSMLRAGKKLQLNSHRGNQRCVQGYSVK